MANSRDGGGYPWIGADEKDYIAYMREEWGVPVHDDRRLFEMLILETFQAGLSWATILKRRDAFRDAFANWDVANISRFGPDVVERLMQNPAIIRNRRKIESAITNAEAFLEVQREFGSFDVYLWAFVDGEPITRNKHLTRWQDLPTESEESRALAKDLKRRRFRFVGPTSCYAYMQAVGLVDDRIGPV